MQQIHKIRICHLSSSLSPFHRHCRYLKYLLADVQSPSLTLVERTLIRFQFVYFRYLPVSYIFEHHTSWAARQNDDHLLMARPSKNIIECVGRRELRPRKCGDYLEASKENGQYRMDAGRWTRIVWTTFRTHYYYGELHDWMANKTYNLCPTRKPH